MHRNLLSSSSLFLFAILVTSVECLWNLQQGPKRESVSEGAAVTAGDAERLRFALNLEFVEAEWFLHGALGYGLDKLHPELAKGGPPSFGAKTANLDILTRAIIEEFGYQEIGHLKAITSLVGGFPRPLIDLSPSNFAKIFKSAVGHPLSPPFDPYKNTVHYLLACYMLPYLGLTSYDGSNADIDGREARKLLAGLLAVEAGQDAVIRSLLYARQDEMVYPYNYTVAQFTTKISDLMSKLGGCGRKDEGLIVPKECGAEGMTNSNILSANYESLGYERTPSEVLRVIYGTGNESKPGGFLPKGGNGKIAKGFLKHI